MLGLILKDLLCLKKTFFKMVFVLGLYIVIFSSSNNIILLCAIIILILTLLIINTFSYDEVSKWEYYALALPVTKKQIVLSKYLLTLLFDIIGFSIALLLFLIKRQLSIESVLATCVLAAFALVLAAILLPLLYKEGTQKARIWIFLIFLTPTAVATILFKLGFRSAMNIPSDGTVVILLYLSLPVALLLYAGSYFLSCHILENKEI